MTVLIRVFDRLNGKVIFRNKSDTPLLFVCMVNLKYFRWVRLYGKRTTHTTMTF